MNGASRNDPVPVAGLTRLTTIDFPGKLSAVAYLQGCPWRCGYCQNSELQARSASSRLCWSELLTWLESRQGLLDAVVFSGGEPTLHRGLVEAVRQVRALGFLIGLHTAGIYPQHLKNVLPLVDWVGFDIKAAFADYARVTGNRNSASKAWQSLRLLLDSGVDYECRTTLHPDQLSRRDIRELSAELVRAGVDHFVVQHCVLGHCADEQLRHGINSRLTENELQELGQQFTRFVIRDAA